MSTYTPYVYLIGWSKLDRWYYGLRYGKGVHPSDFWTKYFTSSKDVAAFREYNGEPDIIEIRRTFESADAARKWEFNVLRRLKVVSDPRWINRSVPGYFGGFPLGKSHSIQTRKKMSEAHTGRTFSSERRKSISDAKKGMVFEDDHRKKLSEAATARWARRRLSLALLAEVPLQN